MEQVFTEIAKWNAARYEREYDNELTIKLLREEYYEWLEAESLVDKVHELCDVIYVALGAIWKLDVEMDSDTVNELFIVMDALCTAAKYPGLSIIGAVDSLVLEPAKWETIFGIQLCAQAQLLDYGLSFEDVIECMLVLCESNASKTIKKTASNVKANDNDKGVYYKSPIPGLTKILEKVNEQRR